MEAEIEDAVTEVEADQIQEVGEEIEKEIEIEEEIEEEILEVMIEAEMNLAAIIEIGEIDETNTMIDEEREEIQEIVMKEAGLLRDTKDIMIEKNIGTVEVKVVVIDPEVQEEIEISTIDTQEIGRIIIRKMIIKRIMNLIL